MSGTETLLREPAIQAVGWALLHFVWQGTLVGLLAAVALRALRNSAADVRYVVSAIALALMATLPIVTGVQAWRAARIDAVQMSSSSVSDAAIPAAQQPASASVAAPPALPIGCGDDSSSCSSALSSSAILERWLPMLVLGWMFGVAILALRLAGGWMHVSRMKTHGALPADAALQAMVSRLTRSLHLTRAITLVQSSAVEVPTVIGWLKPTVLLPIGALSGLTPLQIEAILAHELAHIRRHDYFVNLLQSLIETLLFYHPAVWWLSRRIRIEREHCCDDLAVSLCGDPVVYASALADLEELRGQQVQLVMAASGGALLARVRRLLAAPTTHAGRGPAWLAAATAFLLVLAIIGGPMGRHSLAAARTTTEAGDAPETLREWIGQLIHLLQNIDRLVQRADQDGPPPPPPPAPPAPPAPPPPPAGSAGQAVASVASVASVPSVPSVPDASDVSITFDGTRQESSGNYTWSNNGEKLSVDYRGSFTLNDSDTDIVSMSPGAYLRISDGGWLRSRSIEFTADGSGNITRRYYRGSSERPFEPEGREWLAQVFPRFVRQSGFAAKERVARFLAKGGVPAVLAEISQIQGSYGKKVYFTQLLKQQPSIDPATGRLVLEQAGREIDSNYELATTLIAAADQLLVDDGTRKAYFDAARNIESDYEMRRTYSAALKRGQTSPALIAGVLDASRSLDSDYEAASLLLEIVKGHAIEGQARAPFFSAVETIGSSYEKSRVLQALVRRDDVSAETLLATLEAARSIGSDYETSQLLVAAARSNAVSGPGRDAYIRVAETLGEYERNRALAALARTEK